MELFKKIAYLTLGFFFLTLGIIGVFLPLMPTIPFCILASICFSKSSKKFHHWLLNNRWIGPQLKDFYKHKGMQLWKKSLIILGQWFGVGVAIFFSPGPFVLIPLIIISIGVTIYILSLETLEQRISR